MSEEMLKEIDLRSGTIIRAATHVEQSLELALAYTLTGQGGYVVPSLCSEILGEFGFGKKIQLYLSECKRWGLEKESRELSIALNGINKLRNLAAHAQLMQDAHSKQILIWDGKKYSSRVALTDKVMTQVEQDRLKALDQIWKIQEKLRIVKLNTKFPSQIL